MSNLEQRRNTPRRRLGGMHPGWMCFMAAHWGGFFLALAVVASFQWALVGLSIWCPAILFALWLMFFIIGGRKAEGLFDRHEF